MRKNRRLPAPGFRLLVALARAPGGDADGGGTATPKLRARMAADRTSSPPSVAAFYRHLQRLVEQGLVEVVGAQPAAGRGRPSQLVRATREGERVLMAEARRLESLAALAMRRAPGAER